MRPSDATAVQLIRAMTRRREGASGVVLTAISDEQSAAMARLCDRVEYLSAGLDAVGRAGRVSGQCLDRCSSWSEDYRVNDCDCGYSDAADNSADFAEQVLAGDVVLDAAWRS